MDRRLNPIEDNVDDDGLVMEHTGFDMFGLDITLGDDEAKPAPEPESAPQPSRRPEWLLSTPAMLYTLEAESSAGGEAAQLIELTEEEYNSLKESLHNLRSKQEAAHA